MDHVENRQPHPFEESGETPVAPLSDAMLLTEILLKGAVIRERLVAEYGFTGSDQRIKMYLQEARPRIAEELGISPHELAGLHRRFEVVPGAQAQVDWVHGMCARTTTRQ